MIVSHDSGFLDNVCTDIIDYANRKLTVYKVRGGQARLRLLHTSCVGNNERRSAENGTWRVACSCEKWQWRRGQNKTCPYRVGCCRSREEFV